MAQAVFEYIKEGGKDEKSTCRYYNQIGYPCW